MLKMLVKFPILKRLIPSILKALKIRDKKFKSDGINYLLDLRYLVDRRFYLFGWDDDIIDYLDKFIKDNKCKFFLDIGSCWGIYSLRIAKKNSNVNIISFDVFHKKLEGTLDFENRPYTFIDMESGEQIKLNPVQLKEDFKEQFNATKLAFKNMCGKYQIDYIEADISQGFNQVLMQYLVKRQKML